MINESYGHMGEAYRDLCRQVLGWGVETSPRGLLTREELGVLVRFEDPTDVLATGVGRALNTRFAAADALQVIGGFVDHDWAARWNPRIVHYGTHGAYGPRLADQVPGMLDRLREDRDTRRAVANIWDAQADLRHAEEATDFPCTVWLQLMIRDDRLDAHVGMRANDLWMGFPYDVFTFAQLQVTAATVLGVEPGHYYHHATSLHLYEPHWEKAGRVATRAEPGTRVAGLAYRGDSWSDVRLRAWAMMSGAYANRENPETVYPPGIGWYAGRLK